MNKKIFNHAALGIIALMLIGCGGGGGGDDVVVVNTGTFNKTLVHDGENREYILYIPSSYDGSFAVPLLFNFHGATHTANLQLSDISDMRSIADQEGFILVYPQGTLRNGNAGETHWNAGLGTSADDVGFTGAMIDEIRFNYNVDSNRVYATGFSNGAYFNFELACKLSYRIAAIAPVAGLMSPGTFNNCNPTHPTPVLQVHGTLDAAVAYDGGGTFLSSTKSVSQTLNYWTGYNNISRTPNNTINIPDANVSDGSTVTHYIFNNGLNGTSVEHYKIVGGKHDWPNPNSSRSGNKDMDTNRIIWDFLSKYDISGLR